MLGIPTALLSDSSIAKAQLICMDDKSLSIEEVMFNPDKLSVKRGANWGSGSASGQGGNKKPFAVVDFAGGKNDTLSFTLTLDAAEAEDDLYKDLSKIYALTLPMEFTKSPFTAKQPKIRPPVVVFLWGRFQFQGVVTSVGIDVTLFDAEGQAKRATANIDIEGRAFVNPVDAHDFFDQEKMPKPRKPGSEVKSSSLKGDERIAMLK